MAARTNSTDDPIHFHAHCTAEDCEFDVLVKYEYQAEEGKNRHESWNGSEHQVEIEAKRGSVDFTSTGWDDVEGF